MTDQLVHDGTVAGALNGVRDDVLQRALQYWHNVDETIGRRIADKANSTVEPDGSTATGSDPTQQHHRNQRRYRHHE